MNYKMILATLLGCTLAVTGLQAAFLRSFQDRLEKYAANIRRGIDPETNAALIKELLRKSDAPALSSSEKKTVEQALSTAASKTLANSGAKIAKGKHVVYHASRIVHALQHPVYRRYIEIGATTAKKALSAINQAIKQAHIKTIEQVEAVEDAVNAIDMATPELLESPTVMEAAKKVVGGTWFDIPNLKRKLANLKKTLKEPTPKKRGMFRKSTPEKKEPTAYERAKMKTKKLFRRTEKVAYAEPVYTESYS